MNIVTQVFHSNVKSISDSDFKADLKTFNDVHKLITSKITV